MFDFLRNLTKSAEEKRQETVAAYLDGALNGRERQRFEQEMAQDGALRVHVQQLLLIKQSLRQLPQRSVPRNFVLDPAKYGRPARQPWVQAYPILRTATAMAAFFFIFAVVAGLFTSFGAGDMATFAPAADVAQVEVASEESRVEAETEQMEVTTLEFDAEAGDSADEFITSDTAAAVEEASDEAVMEAAEPAPQQEAPPALVETAVPLTIDSVKEDDLENGTAPVPEATLSALATPLPDRDLAHAELAEVADGGSDTESAETTAVLPETAVRQTPVASPIPPLLWLQLGLGGLLFLLVGLTLYARRQR